jgi:hypothetical protein
MAHIKPTDQEVNKIIADVLPTTLAKLPYNAQDQVDSRLAKHFMYKGIASDINSQLKKFEDKIKEGIKAGNTELVERSENYLRKAELGTPRNQFDLDMFLDEIVKLYPDVLKHKLKELALTCTSQTAAPISIKVEYIGDVPTSEA